MTWHTAKSAFENLGGTPGETQESLLLLIRRRVFLGLAVTVFALALGSDAFLVSAGDQGGSGAASFRQQIVASVNTAYARSVRFVNGLHTLYQVAHLDELGLATVQPAAKSSAPHAEGRVIRCKVPSASFPSTSGEADAKSSI